MTHQNTGMGRGEFSAEEYALFLNQHGKVLAPIIVSALHLASHHAQLIEALKNAEACIEVTIERLTRWGHSTNELNGVIEIVRAALASDATGEK